MQQTIILLIESSPFSSQLEARLADIGYNPIFANSQASITQVMVLAPILALVDLKAKAFDWERLVRYIRGPAKKNNHVPVVGFETHIPEQIRKKALIAGCTALVTRAEIIDQPQTIIEQHRWRLDAELCNRSLPVLAQQGIREFNQEMYFECHETLEDVWNEHQGLIRVFYQGILQIAVGYLHIRRQNWRGAVKVLERGIPKIAHFRPACQNIDVSDLVQQAQHIRNELIRLGPEQIGEFETRPLPTVKFLDEPVDT